MRDEFDNYDNNEKVDVFMKIHVETPTAVLVSECGDKSKAVWLPKSQVTISRSKDKDDEGTITIPEWLAEEKEII